MAFFFFFLGIPKGRFLKCNMNALIASRIDSLGFGCIVKM